MPEIDSLQLYSVYEFNDGINAGMFSDSDGKAYIIINGTIQHMYTVHIDRKVVSSHGSIVSFRGLLKKHPEEGAIQVGYMKRDKKFPSLEEYTEYKNKKRK